MDVKDRTGQTYGKLTVIKRGEDYISRSGVRRVGWLCRCECGNLKTVSSENLQKGYTTSCGCSVGKVKGKFEDLTGQRFNRLVVIRYLPKEERRTPQYAWLCQCDCGNTTYSITSKLKNGVQKSCGCYRKENENYLGDLTRKYKYSNKRLYGQYKAMLNRVYNKEGREYENYGGRGISVCEEWLGDNGYDVFAEWALKNGYDINAPHGECTLDRIDNDGDYCPENCRWISNIEQQNNRRANVRLEYNGEMYTLAELSRMFDIPYDMVYYHCRRHNRTVYEMLSIYGTGKR